MKALFFCIGKTLVNEERYWREAARPQRTPAGVPAIDSLDELPDALASLR